MSDHFISHREHVVLTAAKRRSAKRAGWILIAVAAPVAGMAVGWLTATARSALYESRSGYELHPGHEGLFRSAEGALCLREIRTACVYPSGEVHIPSGAASVTLPAYFALRPHIPGASDLSGWTYDAVDRNMTTIQTREVRGMLSAADTLTRMIEGTVLVWKEIVVEPVGTSGGGLLWVIRDPAKARGARKNEAARRAEGAF